MFLKYLIAKGLKKLLNPPALKNCSIDKSARVCSFSELNSTNVGKYSYVGNQCFMVNVNIGNFCSIADRCVIGGATHSVESVSMSPVFEDGKNILNKNFALFPRIKTPVTTIGNDVWMGMGCYIKAGVTVHNGAVIGMGSVVTHDVPAYEIWAGNPAKKIRDRFDSEVAEKLNNSNWWDMSSDELSEAAGLFNDPVAFINKYEENISLQG